MAAQVSDSRIGKKQPETEFVRCHIVAWQTTKSAGLGTGFELVAGGLRPPATTACLGFDVFGRQASCSPSTRTDADVAAWKLTRL